MKNPTVTILALALMTLVSACTETPESDVKVRTETEGHRKTGDATRTDTVEFPDGVSIHLENYEIEGWKRVLIHRSTGEDLPECNGRVMTIEGMFDNCYSGVVRMPLLDGMVIEVGKLGNETVIKVFKDGSSDANIMYCYNIESGEEEITEQKKFPDGTKQIIVHSHDGFFKPVYRQFFYTEDKPTLVEDFVGGEFKVREKKSESPETSK